MKDLLLALVMLIGLADIPLTLSFWWRWKKRGKPLPKRLEWLRSYNRVTRWVFTLFEARRALAGW